MCCSWFDSKLFIQSEGENVNYLIRNNIAFTQNRIGSWDGFFLYISISIVKTSLSLMQSTYCIYDLYNIIYIYIIWLLDNQVKYMIYLYMILKFSYVYVISIAKCFIIDLVWIKKGFNRVLIYFFEQNNLII